MILVIYGIVRIALGIASAPWLKPDPGKFIPFLFRKKRNIPFFCPAEKQGLNLSVPVR